MSRFVTVLRRAFPTTEHVVDNEISSWEVIRCIPAETGDRAAMLHFMTCTQPRIIVSDMEKTWKAEIPLEQSVFGFRQMVELMKNRSVTDPFIAPPFSDHVIVFWTGERLAKEDLKITIILDPDNPEYDSFC